MDAEKNHAKPTPGKPEPVSESRKIDGYCSGYYDGYWTGMYDAILWGSVALICSCAVVTAIVKR